MITQSALGIEYEHRRFQHNLMSVRTVSSRRARERQKEQLSRGFESLPHRFHRRSGWFIQTRSPLTTLSTTLSTIEIN